MAALGLLSLGLLASACGGSSADLADTSLETADTVGAEVGPEPSDTPSAEDPSPDAQDVASAPSDVPTAEDAVTADLPGGADTDGSEPAPLEFVCDDGFVIPSVWRCDGWEDCADGSDESAAACPDFECLVEGQLESISRLWLCDDEEDCDDGSDEQGCEDFECADGSEIVSRSFVCDGDADCADLSDELVPGCTSFVCASGDETVAVFMRCNGVDNCVDGSDEVGCPEP